VSDVHKVMDGDLDPFIEAFLQRSGVTAGDHRIRRGGAAREAQGAAGARRRTICLPVRADRDHAAGARGDKSDDDPARYALAGRLVALRRTAKQTFAHLEDQSAYRAGSSSLLYPERLLRGRGRSKPVGKWCDAALQQPLELLAPRRLENPVVTCRYSRNVAEMPR